MMSGVDIGGGWKRKSVQKGGIRFGCDWGVCIEPQTPRLGLLTFKHQGCEFLETEEGKSEPASE